MNSQDPWEDPQLAACVEQIILKYTTQADIDQPDLAPHWVDEWGNWRNESIFYAQQPDDWWDVWGGKRYYRICCGWEEPAGGEMRSSCGCPCEAGVTSAQPQPQPAPDQNIWRDPILVNCIERVLGGFTYEADMSQPELAPHWVDAWGNWRNQSIFDAQQPDDWWTVWGGERYYRICCGWAPPYGDILRAECNCPCSVGVQPQPQPATPAIEPQPVVQTPVAVVTEVPPETPEPQPTGEVGPLPAGMVFYAVYDRIWDTASSDITLEHVVMSGDGQRLFYSARDNDSGAQLLFTASVDGSDAMQIALPDLEQRGIHELAISHDGARAFFVTGWPQQLYQVEAGSVMQLLDIDNYEEINAIEGIRTTADGQYVYFHEDRDDLWRIGQGGGSPELVIEDTSVPRDDTPNAGWAIGHFDISDNGSVIVFQLRGYQDPENYYGVSQKHEVFSLDAGGFHQLSNNEPETDEEHLAVSGDGTRIVYGEGFGVDRWYAVRPDGSERIELGNKGGSVGGLALDVMGSAALISDGENPGRFISTDGMERYDIFPAWDITQIAIGITDNLSMSADGSRIAFRVIYGVKPFDAAFYVGYLAEPGAVPDAPVIQSIQFRPNPASDDPAVVVAADASISDPQGLADIMHVSIDELINGVVVYFEDAPIYFYHSPADNGEGLDAAAGDGIYTSAGKRSDIAEPVDWEIVRVGAMDASWTITVADTILSTE
ncbi:MAG: hypothetical protein JXJ20_05240 [Anaerolineae bacterium]|nr:hypothetical protein [Anaerolineae bacterium]